MFFDTSVLIWAFRGNQKAMQLLDDTDELLISSIVYIELIQGAKNKKELRAIDKTLAMLQVKVIEIDQDISTLATQLVKTYFHSHSVELADAFIAATAIFHDKPLITCNVKHFAPIENLVFYAFNTNNE